MLNAICHGDHSLPPDFMSCDRCGQMCAIDELAHKPERFDRWWWHLLPLWLAMTLLDRAALQEGEAEPYGGYCSWCFGPGYEEERF